MQILLIITEFLRHEIVFIMCLCIRALSEKQRAICDENYSFFVALVVGFFVCLFASQTRRMMHTVHRRSIPRAVPVPPPAYL